MVRVKCLVSYNGTRFYGFQIQPKYRTVQGIIQAALKKITQEDIVIHASGRTDAKVHAVGQVFHFDTNKNLPEKQWIRAINHFMPEDIHIKDSWIVDEEFHSRYSAVWKEYRYYLNMGEYDPIQADLIAQVGRKLDIEAMKEATKFMIGCHNYASFCAQDPYGNTYRTIYQINIDCNEDIVRFQFIGDGFRRYMVRYLVGALIRVGLHKWTCAQVKEMVDSEGKIKCLHKAKAEGLYLYQVGYDHVYG